MALQAIIRILHMATGFSAIGAGIVAFLAGKGGRLHAQIGTVYFGLMTVVCMLAVLLAMFDLKGLWPFISVAAVTYTFACTGFWARGRRDRVGLTIHVTGLVSSFCGLLMAFLVNNFQRITGISGVPFRLRLFLLQFIATLIVIWVALLVYRGRIPGNK